jgi:putative transposase
MRNVLSHTPARKKKEIGERLSALFKAPDRAAAMAQYEAFCAKYERTLPAAVKSLGEDWAACLTFYEFEAGLQRYIKTTNALESLFSQVRSRTNQMKIFQDEGSCLMIVGATMQQVKFQRIPV